MTGNKCPHRKVMKNHYLEPGEHESAMRITLQSDYKLSAAAGAGGDVLKGEIHVCKHCSSLFWRIVTR